MPKSRGPHRKKKGIFTKDVRNRGIQSLGRLLHNYDKGDKVCIIIDPSFHKGMPHPRYHGRIGTIDEKRGRAFIIKFKDGGKIRDIIARSEHIVPYKD